MTQRRYLLPFYLSYAVGLIVPVILGSLFYARTTELAKQYTESQIDYVVEEVGRGIESVYRDVQFIVTQMSLNSALVRHAGSAYPGAREALAALLDVGVGDAALATVAHNRYLRDFYLILPTNNTVLGSTGRYSIDSLFRFGLENPVVTAEEFLAQLDTTMYDFHWSAGFLHTRPTPVPHDDLLLLHTFRPLAAARGVLVFLIDRREIDRALGGIEADAGGVFVLRDAGGATIHTTYRSAPGFDPAQAVERLERVHDASDSNLATVRRVFTPNGFVSIDVFLSPRNIQQRTAYVRNVTLFTVIVLVALNTVLVAFVTARNARPVRAMMQALGTVGDDGARSQTRGLRYLQDAVDGLVGERGLLQSEVDRQRPVINALLIESLIDGIRMNDDELTTLLADGGIALGACQCCFVITLSPMAERVARDFYDEFLVKTRLIGELLEKHIDGNIYYLLQGSDRIACIHGSRERNKSTYYSRFIEQLRSAYAELNGTLDEDIHLGVGIPVTRPSRLRNSYDQAIASLARVPADATDALMEYSVLVRDSSNHYYPIDFEIRLLNAVRSGDEQALQKVLRTLDEENTVKRSVRPMMISVLMHELKGTAIKMLTSAGTIAPAVQETLTDFVAQEYLPSDWDRFLDAFRRVCADAMDVYREANRNRYSGLRETDVAHYLEEHFTDPNLSLVAVAAHFGVNDKYLSRFFKEQLRVNYHSYLQNLRLEHARKLLHESGLSLGNVAQACGYASQATFTRAFRQTYGINPSVFRPKRQKS